VSPPFAGDEELVSRVVPLGRSQERESRTQNDLMQMGEETTAEFTGSQATRAAPDTDTLVGALRDDTTSRSRSRRRLLALVAVVTSAIALVVVLTAGAPRHAPATLHRTHTAVIGSATRAAQRERQAAARRAAHERALLAARAAARKAISSKSHRSPTSVASQTTSSPSSRAAAPARAPGSSSSSASTCTAPGQLGC